MHKIKLLPEHLIDQIKAGEVVERPAALLKEIIENSIDAKSTQIDIHIIDNGMELISLEDNGQGMSFEDLPYAFCRHATSKIDKFEDIYNLSSYGFRGEALASISSISRLTCQSTPRSKEDGGRIVFEGGVQKEHSPFSSNKHGTSLYIRDLFYNTPARLKFIKGKTSEKNALQRVIYGYILANPTVKFSIQWNNEEKQFFSPVELQNAEERIKKVLFKKRISDELLTFKREYEENFIKGYISKSGSKGNVGKQQFLFVNGRLFVDKKIHQIITKNMQKVWGIGKSGHYCLFLNVPPKKIDVNVHPSKTLIKFMDSKTVFSLVSGSIKELIDHFETPEVKKESKENIPFRNNGSQIESFIPVSSNYSMINNSGETPILVSHNKFLISLFEEKIVQSYPIEDDLITPLLISEPYNFANGPLDSNFDFLRNIGIEIDRIGEETVVLRSIPYYLEKFKYSEIVKLILETLNSSSKKIENIADFLHLIQMKWTSDKNIEIFSNSSLEDIENLVAKKVAIRLDDINLKKLF